MQEFEVPFRYFLVWKDYMLILLISSKTMFSTFSILFVSIFHLVGFQASYFIVPSLLLFFIMLDCKTYLALCTESAIHLNISAMSFFQM